ncbi:hypothetical protein V6Z11_D11G264000 [Gossypium hirsutum]
MFFLSFFRKAEYAVKGGLNKENRKEQRLFQKFFIFLSIIISFGLFFLFLCRFENKNQKIEAIFSFLCVFFAFFLISCMRKNSERERGTLSSELPNSVVIGALVSPRAVERR